MSTEAQDLDSEPGFPLTVDLSPYVGTPAHCRVWVHSSRKVRWLAKHVRRVARLQGPLLLVAGECVLPPGEPLRVLQPDDTLSVARVEHKWQRPFSFHEDEEPTEPVTIESTSPIKVTTFTLESTPLEKPPQSAKHKHITQESDTKEQPLAKPSLKPKRPHTSTPTMEHTSEEPFIDHEALNRVKERALALLQQVSGDAIGEDVLDAPKKKRRRVRRRRPCKDVHLDLSVEVAETEAIEKDIGSELQAIQSNQNECQEVQEDNVQNGSVLPSQTPKPLAPSPPVVQLSTCSAVPSPTILTYPPPTMLVRNPTPPRAPRVVRALSVEPLPPMTGAALVSTS